MRSSRSSSADGARPAEGRWGWRSPPRGTASSLALRHGGARLSDTAALARALVGLLEAGDLVALEGDLGVGKTAFVRAAAAALGVPREAGVKSPSFALIHVYEGGALPVAHLDLYRLRDADELEALGFRELLDGEHVLFVEWPENAPEVLELADVTIRLAWAPDDPDGRGRRVLEVTAPDAALLADLGRALGARPPQAGAPPGSPRGR